MRPSRVVRYFVILLALSFATHAYADERADARAHYQAGVKFYSGGDYRSAIREFSSAQQIAPADLNNYNLALCYDKLGDAEPAVQYYRAFLDRQPGTDKRAEIEASINRLEAAAKSIASKKADEAKKADVVKPDDKPVGPVLGPTPPAGSSIAPSVPSEPVAGPVLGPQPPSAAPAKKHGVAVAGSIGTPSSAQPVPTGDAQLDRVNGINIDQIRDQRMGGAGSGMTERRAGPAVSGGAAVAGGPATAGPAPAGPAVAANDPAAPADPGQPPAPSATLPPPTGSGEAPKHETPLYKKWWFWAVVAVSGYVVYELATSSSTSSQIRPLHGAAPPQRTGLTLLSW